MSTQAQIDANRLNAQKSTGPVTESGRQTSSRNRGMHHLSNGSTFIVLEDESMEEFFRVMSGYEKLYKVLPHDELEYSLIERMAQHEWMRCRAQRYMDNMYTFGRSTILHFAPAGVSHLYCSGRFLILLLPPVGVRCFGFNISS